MDKVELLIGIAEIAVALAGFTGVVVAFGSRSQGSWNPGDRLRLAFLLEASLTAAGFSLLALLALAVTNDEPLIWSVLSGVWILFTAGSLWTSHRRFKDNAEVRDGADRLANGIVTTLFYSLIILQLANIVLWQQFSPFLAAIFLNLAGAAMQFARLIRSTFQE